MPAEPFAKVVVRKDVSNFSGGLLWCVRIETDIGNAVTIGLADKAKAILVAQVWANRLGLKQVEVEE